LLHRRTCLYATFHIRNHDRDHWFDPREGLWCVFTVKKTSLCATVCRRRVSIFLPTASFQEHATKNRQHRRQKSSQKTALLQDATLLCQRRFWDRLSSDVLSSSSQVCFLRTSHRNVAFYNVFGTLAHAVDKLCYTLWHNRVALCRPFFVCASERAETFSLGDSSLFDTATYTELVDEYTSFLYPWNVYVVSLSGKNVCSQSQLFVLLRSKVD